MNKPIDVIRVRSINACDTANSGDIVIFGLKLETSPGKYEDTNFAMSYEMLAPLIGNLLNLSNASDELRAKNPLHQGQVQSGYVLDLEKLTISLSHKKKGWTILGFHVRGSGGTTKYLIGADKIRLENLRDAIQGHLDEMGESGLKPDPPH